jgi:molybdopterin-guanine dinucleotide biosynthesis protein MobB
LKQTVIAIVGGKKVGKTTTTESLIDELTKRGLKIAAIKHISEKDWTIDTPGKDTWRFAQKGAKAIVILAPNEVAIIEKGPTQKVSLIELLKKAQGNDIVLIEGLKKSVAKKKSIPKIVVVTNQGETQEALKRYSPILAFSGPFNTKKLNSEIPYFNALENPKELADIAEEVSKTKR